MKALSLSWLICGCIIIALLIIELICVIHNRYCQSYKKISKVKLFMKIILILIIAVFVAECLLTPLWTHLEYTNIPYPIK